MICRNAISKNNIKTPDMGKDDLISQLEFSFDIKIDNIDDITRSFTWTARGMNMMTNHLPMRRVNHLIYFCVCRLNEQETTNNLNYWLV